MILTVQSWQHYPELKFQVQTTKAWWKIPSIYFYLSHRVLGAWYIMDTRDNGHDTLLVSSHHFLTILAHVFIMIYHWCINYSSNNNFSQHAYLSNFPMYQRLMIDDLKMANFVFIANWVKFPEFKFYEDDSKISNMHLWCLLSAIRSLTLTYLSAHAFCSLLELWPRS